MKHEGRSDSTKCSAGEGHEGTLAWAVFGGHLGENLGAGTKAGAGGGGRETLLLDGRRSQATTAIAKT